MKKVKFKTYEQLKSMLRRKEVQLHHVSDDGEMYHWGTIGNPSHTKPTWRDDMGQEYLVVDHPNPISKEVYERLKVFFDEDD